MEDKSKTVFANYDEEKETITDENGREWPVHFKLDPETEEKLSAILAELLEFCQEHCIPLHAGVVTESRENGCCIRRSAYFPGARSPVPFTLVGHLFPKVCKCDNPFLIARLADLLKD